MSTQQQELTQLKKDMDKLKAEMETEVQDRINDALNKKTITDMANDAGKNLNRFFTKQKNNAINAKESCEESVKAHPFYSVLGAFAGGAILAALLTRR